MTRIHLDTMMITIKEVIEIVNGFFFVRIHDTME